MPESSFLEAFDEFTEDILGKTLFGLSVIHMCYCSYVLIEWVKPEPKIPYKDDPLLPHNHLKVVAIQKKNHLKDDPSLSDSSLPRNHLKGLKEIGGTYIRETYSVFRQGSFNQSSRK